MAFDLLVVGDCNPDLVLTGGDLTPEFGQREKLVDGAEFTVGGSAAIMACAAARLGLRTALVGAVGDDHLGRFMLDAVAARGVDTSGCVVTADAPTGLTVHLAHPHDRAQLTAKGAIATLTAADVNRELVTSARHLHVASYFLLDGLRPGLVGVFRAAREAGATVSLNPQGDPAERWDSGLHELAPEVDVLFVNEQEDAAIAPRGFGMVVVKRGAQGAAARTAGGLVEQQGVPVDAVDSTGAGDAFDAGFVAARLGGEGIQDALALACACGALSTRAAGGVAAQPTMQEAREALR
ncbi:MAG: carbohydrate kinase family protein [Gaiellales bacterium]